jgi:hypothetical protein
MEAGMRQENRRRVPARTRAAEKASTIEQLTVLVLGAIALLGFLFTS